MPKSGHRWYHLILTTHGSWLPGDPRGFRNRHHRVHSSGDYKHRPPTEEHEKLHTYHTARAANEVVLPKHLLSIVGQRIVAKVIDQGHRLLYGQCRANTCAWPSRTAGRLHTSSTGRRIMETSLIARDPS